jgi:hypothetical protein
MQVCCPVCSAEFPIEAGLVEGDAKRLAAVLADLEPVVARALIGYLRLFKPPKTALRVARAVKLAREVVDLIDAGEVSRDERTGMRRSAAPAMWAAGMEQMAQKRESLTLPLDGHNYLRVVVFALAEQQAARAEARAEEAKRTGQHRRTAPGGHTEAETARDREIAFVRQIHSYGQIDDAERDRQLATIASKYQGGT